MRRWRRSIVGISRRKRRSAFAPEGKFTETIADAVEVAKENKEMKVEYMTYYMELRRSEDAVWKKVWKKAVWKR